MTADETIRSCNQYLFSRPVHCNLLSFDFFRCIKCSTVYAVLIALMLDGGCAFNNSSLLAEK
jgi:hypothetical protein